MENGKWKIENDRDGVENGRDGEELAKDSVENVKIHKQMEWNMGRKTWSRKWKMEEKEKWRRRRWSKKWSDGVANRNWERWSRK